MVQQAPAFILDSSEVVGALQVQGAAWRKPKPNPGRAPADTEMPAPHMQMIRLTAPALMRAAMPSRSKLGSSGGLACGGGERRGGGAAEQGWTGLQARAGGSSSRWQQLHRPPRRSRSSPQLVSTPQSAGALKHAACSPAAPLRPQHSTKHHTMSAGSCQRPKDAHQLHLCILAHRQHLLQPGDDRRQVGLLILLEKRNACKNRLGELAWPGKCTGVKCTRSASSSSWTK